MPFRNASTISPVISTFSSFCAMAASFPRRFVSAVAGFRPPPNAGLADDRDVRGLGALLALLSLVLDLCAFIERLVATSLNRAEMDEEVLAALVGRDEPVPLLRVEPLNGS